ncbi:MAG TPA: helix-turn-helix domain-containing protein, partial [Rickettsia endosymbiont of Sericostoma sp.]|nr:helix-turn-helix domain-containing protein [Rickettsia endosymbiont of Sericostoma sp.]
MEKKTGISRNTVYSILYGSSKNPSATNLQLIAKALDVNL